jgi:hypothetical protein
MPRAVVERIWSDGVGTLAAEGFYHDGNDYREFTIGSLPYTMANPVANQISKSYIAEQITLHLGLTGNPVSTGDVEIL